MTNEEIMYLLPSIELAHLFHSYGKLDEMLELGLDRANEDFYMYVFELMGVAAEGVWSDYNDSYDVSKWYFSSHPMVEYYRLCREYSKRHGIKLSDNPFVHNAESFVECALNLESCGYGWRLQTKINHEWASGIVFQSDCYFNGEMELLEALLEIFGWYEAAEKRLREVLHTEETQKMNIEQEAMAA